VQAPAADLPPQLLARVIADRRDEADEHIAGPVPRQPRAERVPQEVERDVLVGAAPDRALAVDDAGLVLIELEPAVRQPRSDRTPQPAGLAFASRVHDHVVAVALEADGRVLPGHPEIERVVQKDVGQQGRNRRTLRSSAIALDQAAVLALERRLQPPLHVEQDEALVGVASYRLENEVVRDAVEKRLQVQV
jgi:hypothetical protein